MRTVFRIVVAAAWLCIVWVGASPLPDVASLAESTFVFLILWVWTVGWATATIPGRAWLAAPMFARVVLLTSVIAVVVTQLIVLALTSRTGSVVLSGARDVGFAVLLISGLATPVSVITAYVRRSAAR